ncbi:DUF2975 domain-containing protein [Actinomadura sp. HBU206391]|uniref:DUF2975 domain-containing protein n=1 Tax=Actinomadura sp. HBU206391 TaxID=2731692 RepID=UPI00165055DC|nr:DUF2975 domain-containing protein [Actinomadura sp. HBU206391]MBC6458977.1 DUF2975 domain-containing protein [Actinomadura sp. HBU206391]
MTEPASPTAMSTSRWDSLRWLQTLLVISLAIAIAFYLIRLGFSMLYMVQSVNDTRDIHASAPIPVDSLDGFDRRPPALVTDTYLSQHGTLPVILDRPTPWQFTLAVLSGLPRRLVYATFFVLLLRLVREVRHSDPFTAATARRLRFLGWFLVIGVLAASVTESAIQGLTLAAVTSDGSFLFQFRLPFEALLGGMGLIVVAEVVRRGAIMREDLAGTI